MIDRILPHHIRDGYGYEDSAKHRGTLIHGDVDEIKPFILQNQETIKRLHETGYIISKFQLDKTYTQEEILDMFKYIIDGDTFKRERND